MPQSCSGLASSEGTTVRELNQQMTLIFVSGKANTQHPRRAALDSHSRAQLLQLMLPVPCRYGCNSTVLSLMPQKRLWPGIIRRGTTKRQGTADDPDLL
jgi:hypothetical protein